MWLFGLASATSDKLICLRPINRTALRGLSGCCARCTKHSVTYLRGQMLAMVVQVCGGRANVGRCGSRRRCEDATSGITRVARRCTLVRRRRRRRRRRGDAEINRAGGPGGRASGQRYPSSRADAVDTTRPGRDRSTAGCKLRLVQRDGLPTLIGRLSTPISGAVPDRRHAVTSATPLPAITGM